MKLYESHEFPIYRFEELARCAGVFHCITTRHGGASSGAFASLNLSFDVGDDAAAVRANRRKLAEILGIEPGCFVAATQPHGANVAVVRSSDRGRGALDGETALGGVDALVTNEPGLALLCFSADCPSVVLYDPVKQAVGVAHSGWRGTVGGIAANTVRCFQDQFGSAPDDLLACVGPGIGSCCFEVGDAFVQAVDELMPLARPFVRQQGKRTTFDITGTVHRQLIEAGVCEHRIEMADVCTMCRPEEFFSYRADRGVTGRFAAVAGLR